MNFLSVPSAWFPDALINFVEYMILSDFGQQTQACTKFLYLKMLKNLKVFILLTWKKFLLVNLEIFLHYLGLYINLGMPI